MVVVTLFVDLIVLKEEMMGQDVVCQVTVKATSPTAELPALRGAPLELVRSHLHLSDSAETRLHKHTCIHVVELLPVHTCTPLCVERHSQG